MSFQIHAQLFPSFRDPQLISNSPLKSFIWWFLFLFHLELKFEKHSNRLYSGQCDIPSILFKKNLYGPFLWTGFNCLKSTESLQGGSLLFIIQFRKIPGTHLINLRRMKGLLDLGATRCLSTQHHWIGNPAPQ